MLQPVDITTGWDLTLRKDVKQLKVLIQRYRPLMVHFAPVCRIFSQAYHPLSLPKYYTKEEQYQGDLLLAVNISKLALYVYRLQLFVCIENPIRSTIFSLTGYAFLRNLAGFFFVDANMCMYNYRHPVTKELVWKGLRLLTNAPWMVPLGRLCDKSHCHTSLEGQHTTKSATYNTEFCRAYAKQLAASSQWLRLVAHSYSVARSRALVDKDSRVMSIHDGRCFISVLEDSSRGLFLILTTSRRCR